jgi:hypothetical protein
LIGTFFQLAIALLYFTEGSVQFLLLRSFFFTNVFMIVQFQLSRFEFV